MAYVRKTRDEYEIQGYFEIDYGWERVDCVNDRAKALDVRRLYMEESPGTAYRVIKKRVAIEWAN